MALDLQKINELIAQNRIDETIKELTAVIASHPECDEAWFMRGKMHWRAGDRAKAMCDYAQAAELNSSSRAVKALENAQDIEKFYNTDLYNP